MIKYDLNFAKKGILRKQSTYAKASILIDKTKIEENTTEKPVFLIAVIDKSGSMAMPAERDYRESKLDYAKKAVENLVESLSSKDMFALISFNNKIKLEQEPILVKEENLKQIKQNINNIYAMGTTNISDALICGKKLVAKEIADKYNCKILLLSDGQTNVGLTKVNDFIELVSEVVENNISISTMGFGDDYDLDIMEAIAGNSGGTFYHIQKVEAVVDIFYKELNTTRNIISKNTKVAVSVSNGYKIEKNLNKYKQKNINNKEYIELGNLYTSKHIYFEIVDKNAIDDCVVEIEFYTDNKLVHTIKEIIPLFKSKENIKKIEENEDLLKEVIEMIKANYVMNSSQAYSKQDRAFIKNNTVATMATLNNIATIYTSANSSISSSMATVDNLSTMYETSAISEAESRVMYSTSAAKARSNDNNF